MLAKEAKIQTLKKQRDFIERQLNKVVELREDGGTDYKYLGTVYPEVVKYFENKGWEVTCLRSEMSEKLEGLPIYIFSVGDVELTEEELEKAYSYGEPDEEEGEESDDDSEDYNPPLLGVIFGKI